MSAPKRRSWEGRVYLGQDAEGKQEYYWVGRFPTRRERDDAVARARTEQPWLTETPSAAAPSRTCADWVERMLDRMESGALKTRGGRPYKRSTIDTARTGFKPFLAEFGERDPNSITRIEAEDWAP